jgi:hypothetical protein
LDKSLQFLFGSVGALDWRSEAARWIGGPKLGIGAAGLLHFNKGAEATRKKAGRNQEKK